MFLRGLGLVEVLQTALHQRKSVVWLEPDMHYTQNLLHAPDITNATSDVAFMWDYSGVCGCFIRFAPVAASVRLYEEVINSMRPPSVTMLGTKNDQTLLNEIVNNKHRGFNLTVKILDPCIYRSGMFIKSGFPDENHTLCPPTVTPAVQHFNWVVGKAAKIQLAKADGGWYLSANESTCKTLQ